MSKPSEADPDNPEWTETDFAQARPFNHVFPALASAGQQGEGQGARSCSISTVSVPVDSDVAAYFKASGPDWQARLNATLRRAIEAERRR